MEEYCYYSTDAKDGMKNTYFIESTDEIDLSVLTKNHLVHWYLRCYIYSKYFDGRWEACLSKKGQGLKLTLLVDGLLLGYDPK